MPARRRTWRLMLAAAGLLAATQPVPAQEELEPETLTVEPGLRPGANVVTVIQEWHGASKVNFYGADDLRFKGNVTTGSIGQFVFSPDRRTAYTASVYLKRISYGPAEFVLQEFDVGTTALKREIALPAKAAMNGPMPHMLQLSADGRLAYVQNATPATSITVVDLAAGKVAGELPTPGCWGIYPSPHGPSLSTLCGDGTLLTLALDAQGLPQGQRKSGPVFDGDADALFSSGVRAGEDLLFASFKGNLYLVDDAGGIAVLKEKIALAAGVEGRWAPGGYAVVTHNAAHDVAFVAMHPDAAEGSHKNGAREVWAYDLGARRLLHRSAVDGIKSLHVSDGPQPVLFATNDDAETLYRFDVDPGAEFAAKLAGKAEKIGSYAIFVAADF